MNISSILVEYGINLYQDVPGYLYKGLLAVFIIGVVLIMMFLGIKKGIRYSSILLFIEYIFLIYCSTVFFRPVIVDKGYNFQPFWSYSAYKEGMNDLIADNIMNLIMFVPVGLLIGFGFAKVKWWQVLIIGCGISISVEVLQLVFQRGFSEFDDVMHNSLGCMIGYGIYALIKFCYNKFSSKRRAVAQQCI